MIKWIFAIWVTSIPFSSVFANCQLSRFHWECDLPGKYSSSRGAHSLVYCGNTPVYVDKIAYEQIERYQRANVNRVLNVDGEYITSPCIAAGTGPSNSQ